MRTTWIAAALALTFAWGGSAQGAAQDERGAPRGTAGSAARPSPEDARALAALLQSFVKAFNAGNAKAVAALHTPDAHMIDASGTVVEGRPAIEREYEGLFRDNPGLAIEVRPESVRMVGSDSAIEDGHTWLTPKGGPVVTNRYTVVYARRDGHWLQASVREFPGETPSPHDRVAELAWMLGDWVDEAPDAVIHSTCRWSDDKTALIREFTIRRQGRVAMTGTQRIGWDPRAGQIKSWEFDSEGGHGESLWARQGNRWTIKSTGVLQDGRTSTATHLIGRESDGSCRWRTVDRTIGPVAVPDVVEFVMVRKPPQPGPR